ncbi:MAG: SET domain-containing protein-lysine N-methyltransferase [Chitinophagaceae bacterium]|jgi:SET domain-containing protein|nr:MAG: SET domain-containing protein-lysine N-methyltransferase [Chitinophagaceae bacterium]
MNKKEILLQQLRSHTYVMIKPSPLHGIGVFAIRTIPKGTKNIFSEGMGEWIQVSKQEVDTLPASSKDLIENHCLFDEDHYFIPEYGFKLVDLVIYLNHSEIPNVRSLNEGEQFEALRDIQEGEELLVDYGTIVDCEE